MGKTIRNFVLELGELRIPVALVGTVSDPGDGMFRTLHSDPDSDPDCLEPVSRRVYCVKHERVLDDDEVVKAWQVAPGQFQTLTREEVDELTPVDSAAIAITAFTPAAELDPLLVYKRYHLAPTKSFAGVPAYGALAEAMRDQDVVAVTRFHAWNSEQLAAISSRGDVLELATMYVVDDVALEQADEIAEQVAQAPFGALVGELMHDVVARYTRPLQRDDLASLQRVRVRELLERKLAGEPIVQPKTAEATPPEKPVADLEAALRRTLKEAPKRKRRKAAAV